MQKKLFENYPHGLLIMLGLGSFVLACLFMFIAQARLYQPKFANLNIPVVNVPKPDLGFTIVKQGTKANINANTPLLAVTNKVSYFARMQAYKDGLEQHALNIKYDVLSPKELLSQAELWRDKLFLKTDADSRTLVILPAPDINMVQLKNLIFAFQQNKLFDNVVLANGVI